LPVTIVRKAPRSIALDRNRVRRIAERMLTELDRDGAELSILLTDDTTIAELNRSHRGKKGPTDVLAFPMLDDDEPAGAGAPVLLGDVVISLDTANRQAKTSRRPVLREVGHLLAHGILHLVGYDHRTDAEEREMNAKTRALEVVAGLASPTRRP
jgi:probable rRNA maturation factor